MMRVPKYKRLVKDPKVLPVDRDSLNPASLRSYDIPQGNTDKELTCRACRTRFVFSAVQQKKLYEVHKRHIATTRVLCSNCKGKLSKYQDKIIELEKIIPKKGQADTVEKAIILEVIGLMNQVKHLSQSSNAAKLNRYKKMYENLTSQ